MKGGNLDKSPLITVVMSVYNAEKYVNQAVESVLHQSFRDFEFIIIDDGSTDASSSLLEGYDDPRIRLYHNPDNMGLARSLNQGLASAKGEYVARMDADDIAVPGRLEKQASFLGRHADVGILGCCCVNMDEEGRHVGSSTMPETDLGIRWMSLFGNPFIHSSVMMRRDMLVNNGLKYDESWETAQDYELWTRVMRHTKGANLRDRLVWYRRGSGVTYRKRKGQLDHHDRIARRTIREYLPRSTISMKAVTDLRKLFIEKQEFHQTPTGRRMPLAHLYLDMYEQFMSSNLSSRDWRSLKKGVATKVASIILKRPLEEGWLGVLKRIALLEPTIALSVFPSVARK